MTADSVAVFLKHSDHIGRSSLATRCRTPLYSFNFSFITLHNILHWFRLRPLLIPSNSLPAARRRGKNSLLECGLPVLQFKNPLSSNAPANESGQPLNKNCQFPFGFAGQCKVLAERGRSVFRVDPHTRLGQLL